MVFELRHQLRKSAIPIPSNIAEGCGRNSNKPMIHFLHIVRGSLCELETKLIIGLNLDILMIHLNCLMKLKNYKK
jgi:four helix bundle protein